MFFCYLHQVRRCFSSCGRRFGENAIAGKCGLYCVVQVKSEALGLAPFGKFLCSAWSEPLFASFDRLLFRAQYLSWQRCISLLRKISSFGSFKFNLLDIQATAMVIEVTQLRQLLYIHAKSPNARRAITIVRTLFQIRSQRMLSHLCELTFTL